jgi:branched-chain amino acid transport system permease protein
VTSPAGAAGIAVLLAAIALPFIPGVPPYWITVASYVALSAIVALGIVVLTGVAGVVSFGQAMFVGFGAYTTAILTTRYGWNAAASLPVAILISGALAWGIGAITLRLKGHYLPVATIAWNISFFYLAGSVDFFRRFDGISGIPPISLFGYDFSDGFRFYFLSLAILVAAYVLSRNLLDSRVGRSIRSLRGGALAAESFGVDTGRARILAFVYAGVLASVSGWLYAHFQRAINPTPFNITVSIDYLLMAVAGGVGHLGGAILGAGLVTIVRDKLQDVLPALVGTQGNFETIVFGIVLILILQFAPEGLWPQVRRLFGSGRRTAPVARETAAVAPHRAMPTRGEDVLRVTNLRKTFGGLVAVNDVSFTVGAGEIVGLIGPNGAGKSTSFNLITGVLAASAGEVALRGTSITGWPARRIARLGVARTFQHVKLVHGMSVIDNVALGRHLLGQANAVRGAFRLDRQEETEIFAEAHRQLARVGLADHADAIASELALGQQRLVEIARALCLDPVLLLLDEPAAGLRHNEKAALADLLRKVRDSGVSILLVEHDMDFVMGLTDRLVVMNFGAELAQGRPAEIQRNPAVLEAYLGSAA